MSHEIAPAAVAAAEIDRQRDGDRQRRGDACQRRHDDAEPAIRAVVEQAGAEAHGFQQRGHGIGGQFGDTDGACQKG